MVDGAGVIYGQDILKIHGFLLLWCHQAVRTLFITNADYKERKCEEKLLLSERRERELQSGRWKGEQEESKTVNFLRKPCGEPSSMNRTKVCIQLHVSASRHTDPTIEHW